MKEHLFLVLLLNRKPHFNWGKKERKKVFFKNKKTDFFELKKLLGDEKIRRKKSGEKNPLKNPLKKIR